MDRNELTHYGVLGMKWGVRRYQNADGTLTKAGKKRASKEYKQASDRVIDDFQRNHTKMYIDAHNKAADYMNDGGIARYNAKQKEKYGENYMDRDDYVNDYNAEFDQLFAKYYNKSLNEFYQSNENAKKAREIVKKYDMTKWDDFAKANEEAVEGLRKVVEEYKD